MNSKSSTQGDKAYVPPHRRRKQEARTSQEQAQECPDSTNVFTRVCCINLRRRPDRWDKFLTRLGGSLGDTGKEFIKRVERFDATDGAALLESSDKKWCDDVLLDWDATNNALYDRHIEPPMQKRLTSGELGCAMSHVRLWKELTDDDDSDAAMLVLEDDAVFYKGGSSIQQQKHRKHPGARQSHQRTSGSDHSGEMPGFLNVLSSLLQRLPNDWQILYLGFSDRGDRLVVPSKQSDDAKTSNGQTTLSSPEAVVFKPTYGFHTHAYALRQSAARVLLSNLPVRGPIDVWLADNQWFGLNVYCGLVANEGWRGTGASLISQDRRRGQSDIAQSGRVDGADEK